MPERRAEPRFLCSDLVDLRWRDESRHDHSETVVLENISGSGASVQSETSISEGTQVQMTGGKREFHGVVRSCYWRDDAYFVGIAFDADSKWSKAKYKPKHFLDPREVRSHRTTTTKRQVMFAGVFAKEESA
jgi:hypothetical protein